MEQARARHALRALLLLLLLRTWAPLAAQGGERALPGAARRRGLLVRRQPHLGCVAGRRVPRRACSTQMPRRRHRRGGQPAVPPGVLARMALCVALQHRVCVCRAMQGWLEKFPAFQGRPFYIAGESCERARAVRPQCARALTSRTDAGQYGAARGQRDAGGKRDAAMRSAPAGLQGVHEWRCAHQYQVSGAHRARTHARTRGTTRSHAHRSGATCAAIRRESPRATGTTGAASASDCHSVLLSELDRVQLLCVHAPACAD